MRDYSCNYCVWLTWRPVFCGPHHPRKNYEPRGKSQRECFSFSLSSLPVNTHICLLLWHSNNFVRILCKCDWGCSQKNSKAKTTSQRFPLQVFTNTPLLSPPGAGVRRSASWCCNTALPPHGWAAATSAETPEATSYFVTPAPSRLSLAPFAPATNVRP